MEEGGGERRGGKGREEEEEEEEGGGLRGEREVVGRGGGWWWWGEGGHYCVSVVFGVKCTCRCVFVFFVVGNVRGHSVRQELGAVVALHFAQSPEGTVGEVGGLVTRDSCARHRQQPVWPMCTVLRCVSLSGNCCVSVVFGVKSHVPASTVPSPPGAHESVRSSSPSVLPAPPFSGRLFGP